MDNPTTRTRIFLGIAFIILLVLSYFVIRPFFTTILFTIILIIVLKPLYNYLLGTKLLNGHKRLSQQQLCSLQYHWSLCQLS